MNLLDAALHKPNTNKPMPQQKTVSNKPISTTNLHHPDRPAKSYLVKEPIYMLPVNFVKDLHENLVNIKNGIKGKSNDHDLGRINDFAMKAGALGLAGYLFTRAKTPLTKSMEFFGFGAFFASMALWPKLFIQTPLKAMYGIDIHQRYVDNEGRKKMFFQDPQYIPWDLYSAKDLEKLGDKLGIPKNIHNRDEVTKRKAHKIALQGNTLWMLTAGFATPLGSALLCNGAEKIIAPALEKARVKKATKALANINSNVEKAMLKYNPDKLVSMLNLNKGHEVSPALFDKIVQHMLHDSDILAEEAIKSQMNIILSTNKNFATKEYAQKFLQHLDKIGLKGEKLNNTTKAGIMNLAGKQVKPVVFHERVKKLLLTNNFSLDKINALNKATNQFRKAQANTNIRVLTPEAISQIKTLDRNLYEFATKKAIIDNFNRTFLGDVAESVAANKWNKVTNTFYKILNLSSDEEKLAKLQGPHVLELLTQKMDKLVADDKAYTSAISKIQNAILEFDKMILPNTENGSAQGVKATLDKSYTELLESSALKFRQLGFNKIADRFVGNEVTSLGCLKNNLLDRTRRRTEELRNGLYKILHVMDCFKRASGAEKNWESSMIGQQYKNLSNNYGGANIYPTTETFMKDLQRFKKIVLNATIADYTTKFGYRDPEFAEYDRMMKLIYTTEYHDATKAALKNETLGNTSFLSTFNKKIRDSLSNLGNYEHPHAVNVKTINVAGGVGDILVRDSLVGPRMDNLFRETASNIYNSSKWLKMFGTASLVLVGITLLAQTFFGRLNEKEINIQKDKN